MKQSHIFAKTLLAVNSVILCLTAVEPWYESNHYSHRLTISNISPNFGTALTDYPLLVQIDSPGHHLFSTAKIDGLDIVFTGSDKTTKLDHEIEYYTNAGRLTAWVKVPSLSSSSSNLLYCYYGYPGAGNQQNRTAVWDANHKIVMHFASNWGSPATNTFDSTANNNYGWLITTPTALTNFDSPAGRGYRLATNTSNPYYRIEDNAGLRITNIISMEFVINLHSLHTAYAYHIKKYTSTDAEWAVYFFGSGPPLHTMRFYSVVASAWPTKAVDFVYSNRLNEWLHFAWTYNLTNGGQLYVNGQTYGARTGTNYLGTCTSFAHLLQGGMFHSKDEFRFSSTERSASWINANYHYMASNCAYIVPGSYYSSNANVYLTPSNTSRAISLDNNFTLSSLSPNGTHTNTKVIFGDGVSSNLNGTNILNPLVKKFFTAGVMTNWMIGAFDNGAVVSNSSVVQIGEYELPKLDMYFVPKDPYVGQRVVFIANSSARYGTVTNWRIDFGTGSKYIWRQYMTNHPVSYSYPYSGEFIVRFSVVDEFGFSNNFILTNTVTDFGARDVKKMPQRVFKYGRDFPLYFKYRLTGEARKVQLRVIHMNGMILRNLGFKEGYEGEDLLFTWDGKTQWNTYLTHPPCFLRYDVYSEDGFIETVIEVMIVYN